MCGIAGIYSRPGQGAPRSVLLTMAGTLAHRGPDGTGIYQERRFGMVNTRLSIVDLEGGDQPLSSEDRRFWVMQNGEIYNGPELRVELEALGHRFETHCDTEVLVHAFEEWGPASLERLNGAFAYAIWDRQKEELFLARDRFGIRPLFLAEISGTLLFGSEAKALLCHPDLVPELDPLAISETFSLWANGPDRSAFRGIRELPPAHYLIVGPEGIREQVRWWSVEFARREEWRQEPVEDLAAELLELLEDSTSLRLRADVPVGAYLSGGLDSSATAAIVRRLSEQTLSSYALSFKDPLFDESEFQRRMAAELGTELETIQVGGREIAEAFPETVRFAEKPMLRTAPAPLFLLSRKVRESGLKVVLTGEGADEVFAGYNIFRENKVRRFWAREPESQARPQLIGRLYPYLARDLAKTGGFMKAFFGKNLTDTQDPLYSHLIRFENTARCQRFMTPEFRSRAAADGNPQQRLKDRLPDSFDSFTPLGKAQYLEIHTFMQGYLLHSQGDRMLMGNSIEGRFPFLDHRLIEFAAQVPDSFRLRALQEKFLLRRAVKHLLPPEIGSREKRPYRAPILDAFMGPGAPDYVEELLGKERLERAGVFSHRAVEALRKKCLRNLDAGISETDEMALVGVISTMLLHDRFVESPPLTEEAIPNRAAVALGGEVTVLKGEEAHRDHAAHDTNR
jgi:asparagine synthase (glutamine-hydrolysing)